MRKLVCRRRLFARSAEAKEDWLGGMILFFIIEIAICAREELFPFIRPTIRKLFIAINAGGATNGIRKVMPWILKISIFQKVFLSSILILEKKFRLSR